MGLLAMSRTSLVNFTVNALQLRFAVNACECQADDAAS
jgi:hypothetical protein